MPFKLNIDDMLRTLMMIGQYAQTQKQFQHQQAQQQYAPWTGMEPEQIRQTAGEPFLQGMAKAYGWKFPQVQGTQPTPTQAPKITNPMAAMLMGYSDPTGQGVFQPPGGGQWTTQRQGGMVLPPLTSKGMLEKEEATALQEPGVAQRVAKRKLGELPTANVEEQMRMRDEILKANIDHWKDMQTLKDQQFKQMMDYRDQVLSAKTEAERAKAQAALEKTQSDFQHKLELQQKGYENKLNEIILRGEKTPTDILEYNEWTKDPRFKGKTYADFLQWKKSTEAPKAPLPEAHVAKVEDLATQHFLDELINERYQKQPPLTEDQYTKGVMTSGGGLLGKSKVVPELIADYEIKQSTGEYFKSRQGITKDLNIEIERELGTGKRPNVFWLRKKLSKERSNRMTETIKRANQIMKNEGVDPYTAYDKALKEQEATKSFRIIGVTQ